MPYNLNFPQSLDFMRDSQPLMLTNYASIFTFIGQDHVNFNNGANSGKHNQLTFPLLDADPAPTSMWRIYEKISPFSNVIQLFTQNAANVVAGFTDKNILPSGQVSWVQLPSGIILKWVILPAITSGTNPQTMVWSHYGDTRPFTTQYWATAILNSQTATDDTLGMAYVNSVATSTQVTYNVWNRASMIIGVPLVSLPPRTVFAIGV